MTKMMEIYHNSVLTEEVIKGLQIYPSGVYVDVTYGGGGHSRAILKKLNQNKYWLDQNYLQLMK